ncbi:type I DNA topoisomerase [Candidatus Gottesmanbacteria bacterium]|nr:type I DNA topoisomerase [Candidatus Gottesmanbacteria bacterium]
MKLIIVESPTKARTLSRFLGSAYRIEASMGHVRDLPKSALGVDVEHDFTPSYIIPRDKTKQVNALKDVAAKADEVILATDPDREGEAIAFHIAEILRGMKEKKAKKSKKEPEQSPETFKRIVFHEITETAIKEALNHPRFLDLQLVDAQQARRVLDRLVGYKLSPLLWKKLSKRWLSAGRVQSVAVRLIVEREREIQKFASVEFWTIAGEFGSGGQMLTAALVSHDGVKYEKPLTFTLFDGTYTTMSSLIPDEASAKAVIQDLSKPYTVSAVDKKEVRRNPAAPYTTSTLQQDAGRKLYFSSKKTMQLAQKLYEEGYITYHRTDSVNLSEKFIDEARSFLGSEYGAAFVPSAARRYKTKSKVAQEAHEAIRPTVVTRKYDAIQEGEFNRDHLRLYDLIWKRAVASQAAEAVFDSTTIRITSGNDYQFETSGSVIKFEGFLKVIGRDAEETVIPAVSVGQELVLSAVVPTQHVTSPPPRYTEASLVKTLEEKGIGRPSTYAPILSTIVDRQYVIREEKKMIPTELGFAVTDFLVQYFPNILDLPFTAHMEDDLDAIANGEKEWVPVIAEFYAPFSKSIEKTYVEADKVKLAEEMIDEKCPTCGHELVIRTGKFGKFIACTNFPECTYTRQYGEKVDIKCPRCGGDIVVKKSKRGKKFYGCSNYPTCTFAAWKKEDIK